METRAGTSISVSENFVLNAPLLAGILVRRRKAAYLIWDRPCPTFIGLAIHFKPPDSLSSCCLQLTYSWRMTKSPFFLHSHRWNISAFHFNYVLGTAGNKKGAELLTYLAQAVQFWTLTSWLRFGKGARNNFSLTHIYTHTIPPPLSNYK